MSFGSINKSSLLNDQDHRVVKVAALQGSRLSLSHTRKTQFKVIGSILLLLVSIFLVAQNFTGTSIGEASRSRVAVDSENGKVFTIKIIEGERAPWRNPDTGERTLYPGEACYWTRDGKAKLEPTYVFVKSYVGINEKTYCPDCGKEVRSHNPLPPDELMAEAAEAKNK